VEGLTFQPEINAKSRSLRRANNERPEDFLMKYGRAVKEKHDSQRMNKFREEMEAHNFHPKISKMSERIISR
jgi:hypothetical protein